MKQTVEAAAREYSNDQRNRQHHCEPYCIVDFKSGVEWQSKQSPWISVKERLPENNTVVLTRGAYGFLICQLSSLLFRDKEYGRCKEGKILSPMAGRIRMEG